MTGGVIAAKTESLVLGIDTCGSSGSVAVGRLLPEEVEILAVRELLGRTYSATLIAAVAEVLSRIGVRLDQIHAIVAVHGPGSFTGVRVGLSAVKGLAEPAGIPVVAVSRLAVLAFKAGVDAVALDAQRNEVFLRIGTREGRYRELLAAKGDLVTLENRPKELAVAEESAGILAGDAWPEVRIVRVNPPTAADALHLAGDRIRAREFTDLAALDGHYLRRPDAEILTEARMASSGLKA
jgi:tRNA threonylcarbamoyladenosine biosynthesis protein TsaB